MTKADFIIFLRNALHYRVYLLAVVGLVFILILLSKFLVALKETKDEALEHYDKRIKSKGNLKGTQKKMSQLGIMYYFDNYDLQPSEYLTKRMIVALLIGVCCFVIALFINVILGKDFILPFTIFGLVCGYFGFSFYFKKKNDSDNEDMIMDIYNSYISLKSQIEAGQYIGNILTYIHDNSKNPRYKAALKELVNNLADKHMNSIDAIDIFQNRFMNPQIKKFCSALRSYYTYGQSNKFFEVLTNEITSIIEANNIKEESAVQTKTSAICFAMFALIVVAGIYCFITGFDSLTFF